MPQRTEEHFEKGLARGRRAGQQGSEGEVGGKDQEIDGGGENARVQKVGAAGRPGFNEAGHVAERQDCAVRGHSELPALAT